MPHLAARHTTVPQSCRQCNRAFSAPPRACSHYLQLRGKLHSPREYLEAAGKLTSSRPSTTFGKALEELIRVTSQKALPIDFLGGYTEPFLREAFSKADIVLKLTFLKPIPKVDLAMYGRRDTNKPSLEFNFRSPRHRSIQPCDRSDTTGLDFKPSRPSQSCFVLWIIWRHKQSKRGTNVVPNMSRFFIVVRRPKQCVRRLLSSARQ